MIMGLRALKRACAVAVYTDSVYVKNGITTWLKGWKKKGWLTADGKPVKNQDLWEALDVEVAAHDVAFHWVKGHAGHPLNERADGLARKGVEDNR